MHTLNILSLNVNGLNSAVKHTRVLEYLHRKSISCALIQETHLKQSDVARFQNKYYKLIAFSCAQNKTKVVLILVNRKLNLTIEHLGSDEKGRFVLSDAKYIIIGKHWSLFMVRMRQTVHSLHRFPKLYLRRLIAL